VKNLIDETVRLRVVAGHEIVAVCVACETIHRLTRMVREQLIQTLLQVQDFPCLNFDVRRLTTRAAERSQKIRIVFESDDSARGAKILIKNSHASDKISMPELKKHNKPACLSPSMATS